MLATLFGGTPPRSSCEGSRYRELGPSLRIGPGSRRRAVASAPWNIHHTEQGRVWKCCRGDGDESTGEPGTRGDERRTCEETVLLCGSTNPTSDGWNCLMQPRLHHNSEADKLRLDQGYLISFLLYQKLPSDSAAAPQPATTGPLSPQRVNVTWQTINVLLV